MLTSEMKIDSPPSSIFSAKVYEVECESGMKPLDVQGLSLEVTDDTCSLVMLKNGTEVERFVVDSKTERCSCGKMGVILTFESKTIMAIFANVQTEGEFSKEYSKIRLLLKKSDMSTFEERTEDSSATQYFQFYGYLSQQQNMLQDYVRTSTYQRAILDNHTDFDGKIVLDVGAGSGILSFFAIQAGAKHVYAIEASGMADHCKALVKQNGYGDKITIIHGMIEEVEVPEEVDTIISEPMGYMLYNERMLETYIHARKWLKKDTGRMFPTKGTLYLAPFSDEGLFQEVYSKANFWYQTFFYGVDLSNLRQQAYDEYFKQPIVDAFDPQCLVAKPTTHTTNFLTDSEESLRDIQISFTFYPHTSAQVHGVAFWFDVSFEGSNKTVFLSTGPSEPLTHWYQVRCLVGTPLFARPGQPIIGNITLTANKRQSYDVKLEMGLAGTGQKVVNTLDLKNPYFRYNGAVAPPPGNQTTSPSETYWNTENTYTAAPATGGIAYNGLQYSTKTPYAAADTNVLSPNNRSTAANGSSAFAEAYN